MKLALVAIAAAALLSACGNMGTQEQRDEFRRTIPICDGADDCKAKWEAAQIWVVHHSGFKIQTATDVLIQTYSSGDSSDTRIQMQVTKEPLGGGRYQIAIALGCNNLFGCGGSSPAELGLAFNRQIADVHP